jgi:hypothetical protein
MRPDAADVGGPAPRQALEEGEIAERRQQRAGLQPQPPPCARHQSKWSPPSQTRFHLRLCLHCSQALDPPLNRHSRSSGGLSDSATTKIGRPAAASSSPGTARPQSPWTIRYAPTPARWALPSSSAAPPSDWRGALVSADMTVSESPAGPGMIHPRQRAAKVTRDARTGLSGVYRRDQAERRRSG